MQQLGACTTDGWLTLIESGAAEVGALAASACESMRRALISLNKTKHRHMRKKVVKKK